MLVTLPFVLLLLDYWPLGRWQGADRAAKRKILVEKIPFLVISIVSSGVTFVAQRTGGAVAALNAISLDMRIENALLAYVLYLKKMVWPTERGPLYNWIAPGSAEESLTSPQSTVSPAATKLMVVPVPTTVVPAWFRKE